ncbi:aminopeptidase P N-terminal domain-containing protein [Tahibacter amnicola]|uniref:Xaa-Pro aminopeptidase n=1 Tax=Tahibacter amnicola TaxID=2976241 RepID=A0ABY6BI31_9GAMM|nr:aminopeptidase P N-terminal domain-containing protein [Tahibacter amnicola]UXI69172.1 aminopeptidase P N-terminal domain-containing protein [Tahibacter amnicola]
MISPKEYTRRRRQLMRLAGGQAIVVVPAAPQRLRNSDATYPYRQDSDFHYLSGFPEPEAVLALLPGRKHGEAILFCRERDKLREAWEGPSAGPEGAVRDFGMDDAFPIDDIDDILPGLIEGRSRVYYHFGRDSDFDLKLIGWVKRVQTLRGPDARAPREFVALSHLLHDLRLFKSRDELRVMRQAAAIAAEGHLRAMRVARAGMAEHQVEAELHHAFRSAGAVPSYEPIVGSGHNACVLHYRANNGTLSDGDLLLIDAGAEYACYASDITRTFPVNGRFTREQAALYQIVLDAQEAAIAQARPGRPWLATHEAAVKVIAGGLCDLGLIKGDVKGAIESGAYKAFFPHKTGHWLGLDVHDVGDYRVDGEPRVLEPGMVMTVEPGIYIAPDARHVAAKWRGIGIRIEDDVVVTQNKPEVITDAVPKTIAAIEAFKSR